MPHMTMMSSFVPKVKVRYAKVVIIQC